MIVRFPGLYAIGHDAGGVYTVTPTDLKVGEGAASFAINSGRMAVEDIVAKIKLLNNFLLWNLEHFFCIASVGAGFFRPEVFGEKFVLLKSHYAGAWRDPGMERSSQGADDIEELPELSLYPSHVCKRE